jgi:hypothetical protein
MTTRPIHFVKMQGAGNDYVYIDCFAEPTPADPAALAMRIADRHFGVGGDGLVLVMPSTVAAARMRMFNADGSESEMCGNGVRCVAHLVVARGRAPAGAVTIETGRGVLTLDVMPEGPRRSRVRVDMGEPILKPAEIPVVVAEHAAAASANSSIVDAACAAIGPPEAWWEEAGLDPRLDGQPACDLLLPRRRPCPVGDDRSPDRDARDLSPPGQRALRRGAVTRAGADADVGAWQRHHDGLRHRCIGSVRVGRPLRSDGTADRG